MKLLEFKSKLMYLVCSYWHRHDDENTEIRIVAFENGKTISFHDIGIVLKDDVSYYVDNKGYLYIADRNNVCFGTNGILRYKNGDFTEFDVLNLSEDDELQEEKYIDDPDSKYYNLKFLSDPTLSVKSQYSSDYDEDDEDDIYSNSKPQYIPKCPTCGSPDIEKISNMKKGLGFWAFGIFSSNMGKTMCCKNCGYKW